MFQTKLLIFIVLILIENLFSATSEANVYLDEKDHGLTQKIAKKKLQIHLKAPSHESTKSFDGWICLWSSSTQPCSCDAISRNFSPRISKFSKRTTSKTNIFFSSIQTTQSLVEIWRRADARSWKRDGGPVIWCQKYSNNCYHGLSSSNTKNSYATHTFCFVDLSSSRWGDFDWPSINESWQSSQLNPHPPIELIESSATSKKARRWVKAAFCQQKSDLDNFRPKTDLPSLGAIGQEGRKFPQCLNSWW